MIFIYAFMVQMIYAGIFFLHFIKTLIFQVLREGGVERAKHSPQNTVSVAPYILGTIHHMIVICGTQM